MSVAAPARTLAPVEPLNFRRWRLNAALEAGGLLGGRWVGAHAEALAAPLKLPDDAALFDAWLAGAAVTHGTHGCVRYATDGHWLHAVAEFDEREIDAAAADALQQATERVYADLFAVLALSPCQHLLRLWNYFADINAADRSGVERYRRFNAGRQQAFIDARRSAFEGSPAACALGMPEGPLRVYALAGRAPARAIENPRQVSAYRYPERYGRRAPTFSRAALVDVGADRSALFISGTASIVGHATLHAGDVRRQTAESLANIDAVREAAQAHSGIAFPAEELVYTVYVRRDADLPAVRSAIERRLGVESNAARDAIYLRADICRADLLVEIEAHGFASHGAAA